MVEEEGVVVCGIPGAEAEQGQLILPFAGAQFAVVEVAEAYEQGQGVPSFSKVEEAEQSGSRRKEPYGLVQGVAAFGRLP